MAEKHFGFCLSLSSAQGLLSESEAGGGVIYSQAGIILRADGVGKMCKEDDINTRGLYESDEDNKNITMRKKNEANALLMVEITAAHPSLLPDEFIFKRTK